MRKHILSIAALVAITVSPIGCAVQTQHARNPFVQVQENDQKVRELNASTDKNWDAIIDQVYTINDVRQLDVVDKDIELIRSSSLVGYGKAKLAIVIQRSKLGVQAALP